MKLIILYRDGVINEDSPEFIKSPAEWVPIPGSLEAIARLNQAGYRVVIASNQSGIARELFDIATLNAIHQKMHANAQLVGADIDAIFFCPHAAIDNCDWFEVLAFNRAGEHSLAQLDYGLTEPFTVDSSGDVHAPSGPGLGVGIDWDLINSAVVAVAA